MEILSDPRFLYMMLILPSLFGLTLLAEGISKIFHNDWQGLINFFFGLAFLVVVFLAYFFFSKFPS